MTTRKYPRTLAEAFGPHTSKQIDEPVSALDWQDAVVIAACALAAVAALLAVAL